MNRLLSTTATAPADIAQKTQTTYENLRVLLSDREAAALMNCGKSTIWRWASEGVIPRPLKIGGMSRWKLSDLEAVIAKAEAHRQAA